MHCNRIWHSCSLYYPLDRLVLSCSTAYLCLYLSCYPWIYCYSVNYHYCSLAFVAFSSFWFLRNHSATFPVAIDDWFAIIGDREDIVLEGTCNSRRRNSFVAANKFAGHESPRHDPFILNSNANCLIVSSRNHTGRHFRRLQSCRFPKLDCTLYEM